MIISHGRQYIFVHIPKTGGTSLALALEGRAMKDDLMLGDTPKAKKRRGRLSNQNTSGRLWKHSRVRDIYGLVSQDNIERYFTFTLVRNPWDRMVSYYHWLKVQNFDHSAVLLAKTLSFAGFLSDPKTQAAMTSHDAAHYMKDKSGIEQCNAYIRLEHFLADVRPLEAHLGFSLGLLPYENKSERLQDYRTYYDDASIAIVAECCANDISRFGYEFT